MRMNTLIKVVTEVDIPDGYGGVIKNYNEVQTIYGNVSTYKISAKNEVYGEVTKNLILVITTNKIQPSKFKFKINNKLYKIVEDKVLLTKRVFICEEM